MDLSYNNLTALPETIFMRTSLEIFSAAYNQLKEIPVKALNPVQSTLKKVSTTIEVAQYFFCNGRTDEIYYLICECLVLDKRWHRTLSKNGRKFRDAFVYIFFQASWAKNFDLLRVIAVNGTITIEFYVEF